jgi:hypothetical protein
MSAKGPERRAYHSSVSYSKKLYIYGGYDIKDGTLDTLWSLDVQKIHDLERLTYEEEARRGATIEWKKVETVGAQKPGGLAHHTAVVCGDKMYLFGGSGPRSNSEVPLWQLDLGKMRWDPVSPRSEQNPLTRDDHSAVVIQDQFMVVFGGFVDGGERTNEMWRYTFASNRWEKIKAKGGPAARAAHSAVARGKEMILFGGRDEDNEKLNDIWSFNFESMQWTQLIPLNAPPTPRCGHSASLHNDCMLIFGGIYDVTKELNDLQSYCFATKKWTAVFEELLPAATASIGSSPLKNTVSPDATPFQKSKTKEGLFRP